MPNHINYLAAAIIAGLIFSSCLKQNNDRVNPPPPPIPAITYNWTDIADSAQTSLNLFWYSSGKYFTNTNFSGAWCQYWPTAHALDVLVDLYLRKPSPALKTKMDEVFNGLKVKNGNTYINYYYDDMEWMALACLRAYLATSDIQYKNVTMLLWSDIKGGWSSDLGGGIWWRKDKSSKNAPSNLPASILASRLYTQFNDPDDLVWAKKIFEWQKNVLYNPSSGWVYDHIDASGNKNLTWKFTYNQGTFVGAALELYKITNTIGYLDDALKAADYTLLGGQLIDNASGILKDEGGGDGGLFKGVFVRYFNRLIIEGNLQAGKKTQYINFLKLNAQKLWSEGTNKNDVLFNSAWNKLPGNTTDFTTQLSGIMLFEALAGLKNLGLVQ